METAQAVVQNVLPTTLSPKPWLHVRHEQEKHGLDDEYRPGDTSAVATRATGQQTFHMIGIELEYMIVDRQTGEVLPVADEILRAAAGVPPGGAPVPNEIEVGRLCWSNELVLHVIELKTNGPAPRLEGLTALFQDSVHRINGLLAPLGGRLMPTGMHPWMDPDRHTRLWPHDYSPVYQAFDRIFGCRGHGWANLQSAHINLPFPVAPVSNGCGNGADPEEANTPPEPSFGRLHAAVRLVLPILPALAASTPIIEGRLTGILDNRLDVYRTNCRRIPSLTGRVIPEPVFSPAAYQSEILARLYRDLAPHDPEGVLQEEWVNARGAIARFDRNTIEIRLLDMQECPQADLAICAAITGVIDALVAERWTDLSEQQSWAVEPLERILLSTMADAEQGVIDDTAYLRLFGFPGSSRCTAGELWSHLVDSCESDITTRGGAAAAEGQSPLTVILREGPLARRIVRRLDGDCSRPRLEAVYDDLGDCLAAGRMYHME